MATYKYREMQIVIADHDHEHKGYFEAAARHKLVVQKCKTCGLMWWRPGAGCLWCGSQQWEWKEVSGKGTIFSYEIVTHAIMPGFRDLVPYPIVLVELDEQRGIPTVDDGLRIHTMLVDGDFKPEKEVDVAIGKRVAVVFEDVVPGFSIPRFKLSAESPREKLWQFNQQ